MLHQHFDHSVAVVDEMVFHYAGLTTLGRFSSGHPHFSPLAAVCTSTEPGWLSRTQPPCPCPDGSSVWPRGPAAKQSMLQMGGFPSCPMTGDPWGKANAEWRSRSWVPLETPRESTCHLCKAEPGENQALCHAGGGVSIP